MQKEKAIEFKAAAAIIFCLVLVACGEPSVKEMSRLSSPNGQLQALWTQTNAGATTDWLYDLSVVKVAANISEKKVGVVLQTNSFETIKLQWLNDTTLQLNCIDKNVYYFVNRVFVDNQNIRIELNTHCS